MSHCRNSRIGAKLSILFLTPLLAHSQVVTPGDLDPSFGTGGTRFIQVPGYSADTSAVAVQADGKLVIAGTGWAGGGNYTIIVTRLLPDGSTDSAFGSGGLAQIAPPQGTAPSVKSVGVDGSGRIYVAYSTATTQR